MYDEPIDIRLQQEYEREVLTMAIGGDNEDKKQHILKHVIPEMFTRRDYRTIFKALLKLKKENKQIEVGNVCEELGNEVLKRFSIELNENYITNQNCDYYIDKLLNSYLKKLLKECDSFEGYKKIEEIKNKYSVKINVRPISYATDELILEYYNKWGNQIKTYYPQIDDIIGSIQGGDLFILAGATGMGKTCMMLNLIMNMAKKRHKILIFSLEMPLKQIQNRIISAETDINADKIRKFNMTNFEQQKYADFALSDEFKKYTISVCSDFNIAPGKIRDVVISSDCDIVFVDYLGLIKTTAPGNTYERTSVVSRDLKLLANETNKPFIVLHQLSRISSERKDKRPLLSDLRDSGKIEQDADTICFVYRDSYYNPQSDPTKLEFLISKSRHTSGRKTIILDYNADKQKITDKIGEYMERYKQGELDV